MQDDSGKTLAVCADISTAVSAAVRHDNVSRYGYVISVLRGRRIGVFQNLYDCSMLSSCISAQSEKTLIFSVSPLPPQISIVITGNCKKISGFFLWTTVRTV